MTVGKNDPVILIGGFGSHWRTYRQFGRDLAKVSSRRVFIVDITRVTWLVATYSDYALLVKRTHQAVQYALKQTAASKAILVGHSAGGVVARAYLGDRFENSDTTAYCGHEHVSRIYMLGCPLAAVDQPRNAGLKQAAWVDRTYPGTFYTPEVQYLAVAGKLIEGKATGTIQQRRAYRGYRFISGMGEQWGDGVVPTALSTLSGIPAIEIDGVAHSPLFGARWYGGDEASIRMWWDYFDQYDAPTPVSDRVDA
jgi:pimeloyl-ACP methyl ester carboxylesterase